MAGWSDTGFVPKTLEDILSDIETDERDPSALGPEIETGSDTPLGQLNGIMADKLAEVWEQLTVAAGAFDDTKAEGFLLYTLCALTGTVPKRATRGSVYVNCYLTAGTTLVAGVATVNASDDPDNLWVYDASDPSYNSGINGYTAPSTGVHSLLFKARLVGGIEAFAGTLTVINTPVSGWTAATNPLDATPGDEVEAPDVLRQRRRAELAGTGGSTADGTRVDVGNVPGVRQAFVYENDTLSINSDGVPGKAFETVVWDGPTIDADDTDIGNAIWQNKPTGIQAYGTTSVTITDSSGTPRTVGFTRVTQRPVYVSIDVKGTGVSASAVKAAIVAYAEAKIKVGSPVVELFVRAAPLMVTNVEDVPECRIGFSPAPTGTANLTVGSREIAVFDTSRITVNFV